MKLIVGLGNPGTKYEDTRHNFGFIILDHFLKDFSSANKSSFEDSSKFKSSIFILDWQPKKAATEKVILAKPKTFMNNSGQAVSLISSFYKIKPEDIWVVYDELDLPLGTMKIRLGGSSAGHHGVESIIEALKTDKFWRFRIGIGSSKNHEEVARHNFRNAANFVLNKFKSNESGTVKHLIKKGTQALALALEKDIHSAMNRFNAR
jgi:PTH1 family peptidyl-tRNA hydrolase